MTLAGLIDRVIFLAKADNEDAKVESLVPVAFQEVTARWGASSRTRHNIMETFTVAVVNGSGPLNVRVLGEYLEFGSVRSLTDATVAKRMRFIKDWNEIIRPLDSTLGYYTVLAGAATWTFYLSQPGTAFSPTTGFTGNIGLTCCAVPAVPAASGDTIVATNDFLNDVQAYMVQAVKGDWAAVMPKEREVA